MLNNFYCYFNMCILAVYKINNTCFLASTHYNNKLVFVVNIRSMWLFYKHRISFHKTFVLFKGNQSRFNFFFTIALIKK